MTKQDFGLSERDKQAVRNVTRYPSIIRVPYEFEIFSGGILFSHPGTTSKAWFTGNEARDLLSAQKYVGRLAIFAKWRMERQGQGGKLARFVYVRPCDKYPSGLSLHLGELLEEQEWQGAK